MLDNFECLLGLNIYVLKNWLPPSMFIWYLKLWFCIIISRNELYDYGIYVQEIWMQIAAENYE